MALRVNQIPKLIKITAPQVQMFKRKLLYVITFYCYYLLVFVLKYHIFVTLGDVFLHTAFPLS